METTFPLFLSGSRKTEDVMEIRDTSIVVASKELLCCELADGAIILDLGSGVYYALDPVGTYIWGLIQEPKVLRDIRDAILAAYDVDLERCEQDLQKLFSEMIALKLIEVRNESVS